MNGERQVEEKELTIELNFIRTYAELADTINRLTQSIKTICGCEYLPLEQFPTQPIGIIFRDFHEYISPINYWIVNNITTIESCFYKLQNINAVEKTNVEISETIFENNAIILLEFVLNVNKLIDAADLIINKDVSYIEMKETNGSRMPAIEFLEETIIVFNEAITKMDSIFKNLKKLS